MKKLEVLQIFYTFMDDIQQVANVLDMTADCKVTELFCIIDDFCKHYDAENAGNLLEDNSGVKRRRRAASLSDSEMMTDSAVFPFRYIPQQTAPKKHPILLCDISKDKRAGTQGCLAKYPCSFISGISLWVFFIRYRKDGKKRILIGPSSSQIKDDVKTGVVLQVL